MASTVRWIVLADRAAQCPALGLPGWRSVSDAPIVPRHHAGTEFPKESSRSSCPALQHFDRVQQDERRVFFAAAPRAFFLASGALSFRLGFEGSRVAFDGGLECFTGGVEVRMLRRNFSEWEAAIPACFDELQIRPEDAAGRVAWDWARTT